MKREAFARTARGLHGHPGVALGQGLPMLSFWVGAIREAPAHWFIGGIVAAGAMGLLIWPLILFSAWKLGDKK